MPGYPSRRRRRRCDDDDDDGSFVRGGESRESRSRNLRHARLRHLAQRGRRRSLAQVVVLSFNVGPASFKNVSINTLNKSAQVGGLRDRVETAMKP